MPGRQHRSDTCRRNVARISRRIIITARRDGLASIQRPTVRVSPLRPYQPSLNATASHSAVNRSQRLSNSLFFFFYVLPSAQHYKREDRITRAVITAVCNGCAHGTVASTRWCFVRQSARIRRPRKRPNAEIDHRLTSAQSTIEIFTGNLLVRVENKRKRTSDLNFILTHVLREKILLPNINTISTR